MASDLKIAQLPNPSSVIPSGTRIDRHISVNDNSPRKARSRRHGSWSAWDLRHHARRGNRNSGNAMQATRSARFPADPLGLEGLLTDESLNRQANATPLTSPMDTPARPSRVEVVVPPNIADPLQLDDGNSSDENGSLSSSDSAPKRKRKHSSGKHHRPRHGKRRKTVSESEERKSGDEIECSVFRPDIVLPVVAKEERLSVSPCKSIPQVSQPAQKKKNRFQFGNYNRYYGKRNPTGFDIRLNYFNKSWFDRKICLDIGCNIGHITYSIAKDFNPVRIIGVDIDQHLITVARKNLKHYVKIPSDSQALMEFPKGMKHLYGSLRPHLTIPAGFHVETPKGDEMFPCNIGFISENYVGESDKVVEEAVPEVYDTILCLSVTKWIHLNFGDEGLLRLFKRAFKQLKPGGQLILEPQPWSTYGKVKKITPEIFETYKKLKIRPQQFPDLLVGQVGFKKMEFLACPKHEKRGFSRPIQIYHKRQETKPRASVSWSLSKDGNVIMTTQACLENDADEFMSQLNLDEILRSCDNAKASGKSLVNREPFVENEVKDPSADFCRPFSVRQKPENFQRSGCQFFDCEGVWKSMMTRYPDARPLIEKFNIAHLCRESQRKGWEKVPVMKYPAVCFRVKSVEYNGSDAAFHDPTGEMDGWIDPNVISSRGQVFKAGSVIVAKNVQVVVSSWGQPTVNIKDAYLCVVAHQTVSGIQFREWVEDFDFKRLLRDAESAWKVVDKNRQSCQQSLASNTNDLHGASRISKVSLLSSITVPKPPNNVIPAVMARLKRSSSEADSEDSSSNSKRSRAEMSAPADKPAVIQTKLDFPDDDGFDDWAGDLDF
ncbi:unnamed protein product [Notodromas monacha]|uniref:RNA methyltransferase n=1 Tax=Notodromas monacha TaxID=399045 RepID=A0A7R9BDW5_9CRUS|nr:unnamed protein product [Notodromas monacha]CAG0913554.1 unnamed protein product [Notodromas monacha]